MTRTAQLLIARRSRRRVDSVCRLSARRVAADPRGPHTRRSGNSGASQFDLAVAVEPQLRDAGARVPLARGDLVAANALQRDAPGLRTLTQPLVEFDRMFAFPYGADVYVVQRHPRVAAVRVQLLEQEVLLDAGAPDVPYWVRSTNVKGGAP